MQERKSIVPVLALAVLLAVGYCMVQDRRSSAPPTEPDRMTAYLVCKSRVEAQLIAPSTAEFESQNRAQYTVEGKRVYVTGALEAENRLGVSLPHVYTCVLDWQGGDRYSLVDLDVHER